MFMYSMWQVVPTWGRDGQVRRIGGKGRGVGKDLGGALHCQRGGEPQVHLVLRGGGGRGWEDTR